MTRDINFVSDANEVQGTTKKYTFHDKVGNVVEKETIKGETHIDPPSDCLAYEVEIRYESSGKTVSRTEYHVANSGGLVDPTSMRSSRNRMFKKVGPKCFNSYVTFLSTRISSHYAQAVRWFDKTE